MDNSIKSLTTLFFISIGIVTIILTGIYIFIEISSCTIEGDQTSILTFLYTKPDNCMDKDKWQGLIIKIEGFALAILLGIYTAIRMDRTEKERKQEEVRRKEDNEKQERLRREDSQKQERLRKEDNEKQERLRREDKLIELYAEALRNLYTTEKEELQLLGIRELYNTYQELNQKVSPEFEGQLQRKILDSIFEYLREIGVREVGDDKQSKDKAANKIFHLFLMANLSFPGDYRVNLSFPEDYLIHLESAKLQNADLQGAHLEDANLYNAYLQGANLIGANLQGTYLRSAKLQNADLRCAKLRRAHLKFAELQNADLRNANLRDANLELAKLHQARLEDAELEGAIIYKIYCAVDIDSHIDEKNKRVFKKYGWRVKKQIIENDPINFINYVLTRIDRLQNTDLRGAHLEGIHLRSAKLQNAELQGAHLQRAYLRYAELQGAHLEDADLQNTDLQGAHLEDTELQNADLRGAHLQGANLEDADLQGANLEGAIICEDNSSMDIDLLIDEIIKRVSEYGWKVKMQVKEKVIDDDSVEVKQYVLTRMDR